MLKFRVNLKKEKKTKTKLIVEMHKTWKKPLHKRKVVSSILPPFFLPFSVVWKVTPCTCSGRQSLGRVAWSTTCIRWWRICSIFGCSSYHFQRYSNASTRVACSSLYCSRFYFPWWHLACTLPSISMSASSISLLSFHRTGIC